MQCVVINHQNKEVKSLETKLEMLAEEGAIIWYRDELGEEHRVLNILGTKEEVEEACLELLKETYDIEIEEEILIKNG